MRDKILDFLDFWGYRYPLFLLTVIVGCLTALAYSVNHDAARKQECMEAGGQYISGRDFSLCIRKPDIIKLKN